MGARCADKHRWRFMDEHLTQNVGGFQLNEPRKWQQNESVSLVAIWTFRKSISGDLMPSVGKEPYERSALGNRRRPCPQ
nr:MAG TPA: hypothetical protein [Caudoviricetes sp.]